MQVDRYPVMCYRVPGLFSSAFYCSSKRRLGNLSRSIIILLGGNTRTEHPRMSVLDSQTLYGSWMTQEEVKRLDRFAAAMTDMEDMSTSIEFRWRKLNRRSIDVVDVQQRGAFLIKLISLLASLARSLACLSSPRRHHRTATASQRGFGAVLGLGCDRLFFAATVSPRPHNCLDAS
jgi:hypothetical protein